MDFQQVGKSTFAKKISKDYDAIIISTDDLRQELLNDVNNQDNNNLVFQEAEIRIKEHLKNKQNVIFDATNINYKKRMDFINKYKKFNVEIIAILVLTPFEECLERNAKRERKVPDEVIKRMYMNFDVPQMFEGFDIIMLYYNTTKIYYSKNVEEQLDIPHDNPHHKLSVLEHSEKVFLYLIKKYGSCALALAGYLHDIGKPFCKTFINAKGEPTDIAHYYNHEKVGAYDSLFYTIRLDFNKQLYIAQLIQWHMLLHSTNLSEKTILKHRTRMGKEFFRDLEKIHEADLAAH